MSSPSSVPSSQGTRVFSDLSIEEIILDMSGMEPIEWPNSSDASPAVTPVSSSMLSSPLNTSSANAIRMPPTDLTPCSRTTVKRRPGTSGSDAGVLENKRAKTTDTATARSSVNRALQLEPHARQLPAEVDEVAPFHTLPHETMLAIFQLLNTWDKLICSRVCRRWYHLLLSPRCWDTIYLEDTSLGFDARAMLLQRRPRRLFLVHTVIPRLQATFLQSFQLETLDLTASTINPADLAQIFAMSPRLQRVDMSGTPIDDTALEALARHCPRLTSLGLRSCHNITGRGLRAIAARCGPALEIVSLGWTPVSKEDFLALCVRFSALRELDMSGCSESFDDEGVAAVCRYCPSLEVLDASDCYGVTDISVHTIIGHLRRLRRIALSRCHHITVAATQALAGQVNLNYLDLFSCYQTVYPHITSASRGVIVNDSILSPVHCVDRPPRIHARPTRARRFSSLPHPMSNA
ncbi:hypothetical protein PTSG_08091 [Salpingoeca rosetta]|uniref:F-box domain-containing protein n=1 Tax=Salpingoeca rosetta (strain ATCC 50818 / BSB-021) TaxID=946362 RepID=F2UHZ1_SALR5|nr:uncharacterized protein PTSG_08091 [Salpingoeca rosetta]EGD76740.1 hypothetical protein PTSG_08091 [Salpingoeca rosetta]|eukprot:XP_004991112.1 hypothetical protein PTSG_08091 [Salpingoeca rosetta]